MKIRSLATTLLVAAALVASQLALGTALNPVAAVSQLPVNVWWPTAGAQLSGTQPFKAVVSGLPITDYTMYWQVDGGQLNPMDDNYQDYPHKQATVDVAPWTWHGSGPYQITFVAKDATGAVMSTQNVNVTVVQPAAAAPVATAPPVAAAPAASPSPSPAAALPSLYLEPNSEAAQQQAAWQSTRPADATQMAKIASQPHAVWFGDWNSNVASDAATLVKAAAAQGKLPVLVAYNIPQRDCQGYSAGGATPSGYRSWIQALASGIGSYSAMVILEPDALAQFTCLSAADQTTRLSLLNYAVTTLKKNTATKVYLDAGHPGWVDVATIAQRLQQAGLAQADGFSLNVSNFVTTADNISYGSQISGQTGSKHFVIDTSRNGLGPTSDNQWCNPSGRALGNRPTLQTGNPLVDAYLWIKYPGESDGTCNGGPAAGQWWPDYALGLAQRTP